MDMVQELHAAQAFDIVIAGIFVMAPYALALPGVTHVLEEHNSHSRWMYERYLAQTSAVGRLRCLVSWRKAVYYESRVFSQFDLVTMVSEMDAEVSRALLPSGKPPVKVFPNGVDCNELRPGRRQPDPDRLIFSGSLTYNVNYDAMVYFLTEVFDRIRVQWPAAQLHITGSTKGVDLSRLPLNSAVTLTGFVEDIHAEIASAAVSIVPVLSGGGTRLKVLEAMALGTPVVSTTKGAEGIDAIHGEHLLLADDPDSFAAASLAVLSDPEVRQRLIRNAWRLVEERYDWTKIGREFASAVTEVSARCTGERTV
jgi:glycosyltransferase involved in cell wall biosynthesis